MRSSHCGIIVLALALVIGLAPTSAHAQQDGPHEPDGFAQQLDFDQQQGDLALQDAGADGIDRPAQLPQASGSDGRPEVRWKDDWERVRWWQYPLSTSLMAFGFTARWALPNPEPNWRGTIGVDQDLLDLIAVRDDPARANLLEITDLGFYGAMAYRIFDSALVPGLVHDNWDVAWQMSWIDFQAFAVVAGVLWGSQLYVGRVRPAANNCDDPERTGSICDPDDIEYARSFIAGHPATAIAAAGVTCMHHSRMPLYGGGLADNLACGVMVGNAVVNGVTRVMTESHYPSDLLFGTVLGLTAGWVLPAALHYGWDDEDDDPAETAGLPEEESDASAPVFTLSPALMEENPGLMMLGRF